MSDEAKVAWIAAAVLAVLLALLYLPSRVQRELRPEPTRAFVAIQVAGDDFATVGRVETRAGAGFRLYAGLEATGRSGRRVYFTEAPGLVIEGEAVPSDRLRKWPGPERAKVLWFSVEGPRPYVEVSDEGPLSAFAFQQIFRPDWPRAWSIPGSLQPVRDALGDGLEARRVLPFGTQRYHVRIELFGPSSALVPVATFDSPAADDLPAAVTDFPTMTATLDGALALPSRLFGLSQIGIPPERLVRDAETLTAWFRDDLAFTYVTLLRAMLNRAGVSWDDLEWGAVDLMDGPAWSSKGAAAGDLVRAGERVVLLYEDRGERGVLDYDDLCFDFDEGAKVLRLAEVFSGEGLVESSELPGTATARGGSERVLTEAVEGEESPR